MKKNFDFILYSIYIYRDDINETNNIEEMSYSFFANVTTIFANSKLSY